MDFLFDIEIWIGLSTLIVLEIVLGVDNLVFIAILADKLPEKQRDKARVLGLILALGMRLILLTFLSKLIALTAPLFHVFDHPVSGRDLILLGGGLFLLFKATSEIHGRIEGHGHGPGEKIHPKFWVVVSQIVVLDAVFSMDAVITAVGMVEHLGVMMAAVIIAMALMIFASKKLTEFVNAHPTVIMLCLSFLLMVGFSLIADGAGFHVPKGYLYAAIGFSILIEALNQTSTIRRRTRLIEGPDRRQRTTDAVLRILSGKSNGNNAEMAEDVSTLVKLGQDAGPVFSGMERRMITGVLQLTERPIRSIMTPRPDLSWIDLSDPAEAILDEIRSTPHSTLLVSKGGLDEVIGVMRKSDLLSIWDGGEMPDIVSTLRPPISLHENLSVLKALDLFKETPVPMAIVVDEYGSIEGIVTLNDIIQTIAGHIPNEHDDLEPEIKTQHDHSLLMDGMVSIYDLREKLHLGNLPGDGFSTLAGFILYRLGHIPKEGETLEIPGWNLTVLKMDKNKILKVKARPQPST